MARMKRVKNVEREFLFELSTGATNDISEQYYVDMMQCHSLVNRLFARQGHNVLIQSLEIGVQPGGNFTASILRLPQTWACVNAWEKGMALWMKQQREAVDQSGLESTYARYRDFKVHFDSDHVFADNLIPDGYTIDDGGSVADAYEWQPSQVVIPNDGGSGLTTERTLHMLGPDAGNSAGLIHAYAVSRSRPFVQDPNIPDVPQSGLFGEMFDVGEDNVDLIDNLQGRNNEPPYLIYRNVADEAYPGGAFQGIGPQQASSGAIVPGQFVDTLSVNAGQNYNTDTTGSFIAACGLIKLTVQASGVGISPGPVLTGEAVGGPLWMKVVLAPGHYQGIAAVPMQDVN